MIAMNAVGVNKIRSSMIPDAPDTLLVVTTGKPAGKQCTMYVVCEPLLSVTVIGTSLIPVTSTSVLLPEATCVPLTEIRAPLAPLAVRVSVSASVQPMR